MLDTTVLHLNNPDGLLELLQARGYSIRSLAAEVGVSSARIGQLCRGHKPATSAPTAVAIATALDVDVARLFNFPDAEALTRLGLIA